MKYKNFCEYLSECLNQWLKIFVGVWILVVVLLIGRVALYWDNATAGVNLSVAAKFLWQACRYDLRIGIIIALPLIVLSTIPFEGKRRLFKLYFILMIGVTIGVCIVNFYFFREYHDQFNEWIYGLYYDDHDAIMETIRESYPLGLITLLFIFSWVLSVFTFLYWYKRVPKINISNASIQILLLIALAGIIAVLARGSVNSRPLSRDDAAVTPNELLNKITMNPYWALYYTRSQHNKMAEAVGLDKFWKEDISKALEEYFDKPDAKIEDLKSYLKQESRALLNAEKPKHIFLVVVESLDSWPFEEKYAHLHLVDNLKKYSNRGIFFDRFVSAGTSTRTSINGILTGLADASVYTHYQERSKEMYPTAIAKYFKNLGYKTQLFYGGYLSWQRLGELAKWQGIENVYGRENMPSNVSGNAWGADDQYLFELIWQRIEKEDEPTFNIILTTSNHSPYSVDVEALGAPKNEGGATSAHILGHQWYSDYSLNQFIEKVEEKKISGLFAITGDHTSRRFYSKNPPLYEQVSVPLILFSTDNNLGKLKPKQIVSGTHIDIGATLVDLVAEKGFAYDTLGQSMFAKDGNSLGMGAEVIISKEGVIRADPSSTDSVEIKMQRKFNALHGISWWMIMKGE